MSGSGLGKDFRMPEGYRPEQVRIARICSECLTRVFGDPEWECEKHAGKTSTQANRPYFGVLTPTNEAEIPAFKRAAKVALDRALEDADLPPLRPASDLLGDGDGQT